MAHKRVLKCRVKRHARKPAAGKAVKPMAQGKTTKVKAKAKKLHSKHRAHKPRSAKNKQHLARQKAAGATPKACQAAAPQPQGAPGGP